MSKRIIEKPYQVYLTNKEEPINFMAYSYADVVHKAIGFIREHKLSATNIQKVDELKLI